MQDALEQIAFETLHVSKGSFRQKARFLPESTPLRGAPHRVRRESISRAKCSKGFRSLREQKRNLSALLTCRRGLLHNFGMVQSQKSSAREHFAVERIIFQLFSSEKNVIFSGNQSLSALKVFSTVAFSVRRAGRRIEPPGDSPIQRKADFAARVLLPTRLIPVILFSRLLLGRPLFAFAVVS